jgi:hypothetical protein
MARKEFGRDEVSQPSGMTDAVGRLASFAGGVLAQPESRCHATDLKLSRSERTIVLGLSGLAEGLRARLDVPSTGVRSFRLTLDEVALICLALSEALLDAEGGDVVRLLSLTGKVTDVLEQAVEGTPRRKGRQD